MTVKVGQIYKDTVLKSKIVITWIAMDKTQYFMVREDGFFLHSNNFDKDEDVVLIAEYPTWQEAVNSPEFKGVK